jgi:hypothetical protein
MSIDNTISELALAKARVIDAREEMELYPDDDICPVVYEMAQLIVDELEDELEIVKLNCW